MGFWYTGVLGLSGHILCYDLFLKERGDGKWDGRIMCGPVYKAVVHVQPNETSAKRAILHVLRSVVANDFNMTIEPALKELKDAGVPPWTSFSLSKVLASPYPAPPTPHTPPPEPPGVEEKGHLVQFSPDVICRYCGLKYNQHPSAGDDVVAVCNLGRVKLTRKE